MKLKIGEYYVDEDNIVFQLTKDFYGRFQSTYISCSVTPFNAVVRRASKEEIERYLEGKA